ncbi:hypothetical protein CAK95_11755 [Pseudorhodoplanes sinuspersici]|uniref:Uncharacterized protein n=1 Tax=Pseudorhodoplanes sinuspersici TaxID=1235591 RepID=A0A1W6ZQZ6_9HYPH|nr:hypothetical protein CAK95_11755 [Pseudorhodoplanes sinuspersici]
MNFSKWKIRKPSEKDIQSIIDKVRRDGFSWIDGQVFHSFRALAAPICDPQGKLRAAMSLVSNQSSLVKFPNSTSMISSKPRSERRSD